MAKLRRQNVLIDPNLPLHGSHLRKIAKSGPGKPRKNAPPAVCILFFWVTTLNRPYIFSYHWPPTLNRNNKIMF